MSIRFSYTVTPTCHHVERFRYGFLQKVQVWSCVYPNIRRILRASSSHKKQTTAGENAVEWYSPDEMAVLMKGKSGDIPGAWRDFHMLEPRVTPARVAIVKRYLMVWESPENRPVVLPSLMDAIRDNTCEPATMSMLFVEATGIASELNNASAMRELWLRFMQLPIRYPGNEAVRYWHGTILLNFANYHLRTGEIDLALSLLEEAAPLLVDEYRWCHQVQAQLLLAWCYVELNQPEKAQAALITAREWERDGKYAHDIMLAEARVHTAFGRLDDAWNSATKAADVSASLLNPDWQVHLEAHLERLRILLIRGEAESHRYAIEVRSLALRLKYGHGPWWVRLLLLKYGYGGKEAS